MYAIVKTGGKQYTVAPGDYVDVEKIDAEESKTVELPAICVVDGDKVIADPAKAASTKVVASVVKQFKGEKQIVFKFKKRKNYKKLNGHRQKLTELHIESVGSEKAPAKTSAAAKSTSKATTTAKKTTKSTTAAKSTAAKTTKTATAKKTTSTKASSKTTASKAKTTAKKSTTAAKKPAAKKTASKSTKSAAKTTKSAASQK